MEIRGTVVNVEFNVQVAKNGGGSYTGTRFSYRGEDGKLVEKGFHDNTFKFNKELKNQLAALTIGQPFVAEAVKENDFWNWKSVTAIGATSGNAGTHAEPTTSRAVSSPKSTYETPEERAKKQVYIVRQSSFSSALTYLNAVAGNNFTLKDTIETAKQIESYVFGTEFDDGSLGAMKGDEQDVY